MVLFLTLLERLLALLLSVALSLRIRRVSSLLEFALNDVRCRCGLSSRISSPSDKAQEDLGTMPDSAVDMSQSCLAMGMWQRDEHPPDAPCAEMSDDIKDDRVDRSESAETHVWDSDAKQHDSEMLCQAEVEHDSEMLCQAEVESSTDVFDSIFSSDDLWCCSDSPQAAVIADANHVLESALASGDPQLGDAALRTGVRLQNASWLAQAASQLRAAGIPMTVERALDLIRVYAHERRADLAADLWEAQCVENGIDPTDCDKSDPPAVFELYGAALEACARAGDFETAARAASGTGWHIPSCRHGQAAFLALARWYARRQDFAQALECYQGVRRLTGTADLPTHRAVLIASVRSGDMGRADSLFQDLVLSGVAPDCSSFSAMICGHCSVGSIDEALYYFRCMQKRGIVPTASLFDAILDGCAWMNMPALMEQVLAEMEATGIRPSCTTLSILMRRHGMNRDVDQALALFDELPEKHGLALDGSAYGTLISVCLKNDAYDLAWNAFERMTNDGLVADANVYDVLIGSSLRNGYLENAVQVIDEALGMSEDQAEEERSLPATKVHLETTTLENVLQLIGRRRQAAKLGVPLIERLVRIGVELPESLVDGVLRDACTENNTPCSEIQRRRVTRCNWHNQIDNAHGEHCILVQ